MIVYGYIRCSTVEQQDSLKVQEERLKKYCELKELPAPEIYIDSGVSGSIDFKLRPKGKEIWDKIKLGDHIIVLKLDRISRSMNDFVFLMDYFKKKGIYFKCIDPDIDTSSSFGVFMLHLLGSIAQLERALTIDRVKATIKKRQDENLCVGSVPFGWRKDENKKLIEEPNEQKIIKEIKQMSSDGLNNKKIADKLNSLNVLNKKWFTQTIKRILER